ncbi:hypothetical protein LAWI1_G003160 [Lachnellula willkommii]|uniref:N-acetyltransferase domain-containing protein n=1 Tax=Lachnellula willkommii TaxID=215461 RepID=A0A559M9Q2_9HELO|nr:hypothetical protein LAWI1_G003160 [Lachnellula willkommii]
MASLDSTPTSGSSKSQVLLIPWDPTSPDHVQRMVQQRIACGWNEDAVEGWKGRQETGTLNLQWIVFEDSEPDRDAKLLKHTQTHPQEQEPLLDSAIFFGGQTRAIPSPQRKFIPVGHISLGRVPAAYEHLGLTNEEGAYWIGILYVSRALHGSGLGRKTMDTVENVATSEPLCAKILALNAINPNDPENEEKYKALGLTIPPFSNKEWYARRGYKIYNSEEKSFSKVDSTGKAWWWGAVFMKKHI